MLFSLAGIPLIHGLQRGVSQGDACQIEDAGSWEREDARERRRDCLQVRDSVISRQRGPGAAEAMVDSISSRVFGKA